MNEIFQDLVRDNKILLYLDDLLIATNTIDKHLEILIEVFNLMSKNLLSLRVDKCTFLQNEICYLGYLTLYRSVVAFETTFVTGHVIILTLLKMNLIVRDGCSKWSVVANATISCTPSLPATGKVVV